MSMMPFLNISDIGSLSGYEFESLCRRYCCYAPFEKRSGLARILTRYKIYVDTEDLSLTPHLILDGFWESWVTQCLARIVRPGDFCVDVGANLGYYSILLSALSEGGGGTIAVEPNPNICRLLRQTAGINAPGFGVVEAAASDRTGVIQLHIPERHMGDASLLIRPDRSGGQLELRTVTAMPVDRMIAEAGWEKVDVVKIDAEGVEPQVLKGMSGIIASNPDLKIVLEYSPSLYVSPQDFNAYLDKKFGIYLIGAGGSLTGVDREKLNEWIDLKEHVDLLLTQKGAEPPY